MTVIISVDDLPSAVQSNELVQTMVDGANAKASRVATCLNPPTSTEWAATTAYAVGDQVKLADNEYVEVTVAGTSGSSAPTVPAGIDGTVVDGSVTWKRIGPTPDQLFEAKLVLIGAVKRWAEASSGALQSETIDDYSRTIDTRQRTGFNLWPSEIDALKDLCATNETSGAFSIDLAPVGSAHQPWCALAFGANYCSCGTDIAGYPLYEYADDGC